MRQIPKINVSPCRKSPQLQGTISLTEVSKPKFEGMEDLVHEEVKIRNIVHFPVTTLKNSVK